jgi:hypothetical protein
MRRERKNRGKGGALTSPKAVRKIERQYQVMKLRRDGYTAVEIAATVGCAVDTVMLDIRACLNRSLNELKETTEEVREIQLQRLDSFVKTYMPLALDTHKEVRVDMATGEEIIVETPPNPTYAALLLRVEERRARLLALDIPEQKRQEESAVRVYVGIDMSKV